jgi:transposase
MTAIANARCEFPERPWQPLTDEEFAHLAAWLPGAGEPRRGRPPENLRRSFDAIFWVACSKLPWRALPPELGKADTAHRMLRRLAERGVLDRLLVAVSPDGGGTPVLRAMGWWICRAFRRMARVLPEHSLAAARDLAMVNAWPAEAIRLPDRVMSENTKKHIWRYQSSIAGLHDITREIRQSGAPPRHMERLLDGMGHVLQTAHDVVRALGICLRGHQGNRHEWRLR